MKLLISVGRSHKILWRKFLYNLKSVLFSLDVCHWPGHYVFFPDRCKQYYVLLLHCFYKIHTILLFYAFQYETNSVGLASFQRHFDINEWIINMLGPVVGPLNIPFKYLCLQENVVPKNCNLRFILILGCIFWIYWMCFHCICLKTII